IGNLLGEGKAHRAGIASNTSIVMALMLSAASSAMFLIFRNSWAYMFNDNPGERRNYKCQSEEKADRWGVTEVVKLIASIIPLVALFQVFDGNSAVTASVLRARGKQVTGALLNLRTDWEREVAKVRSRLDEQDKGEKRHEDVEGR
ncbi:hypothetical protein DXG01_014879, partial [Tephrocybe rancida]